ncbi:MAG: TRAP transporter TatT component family protein [Verrucomicrobia bacterium]|nr:TRAP transporter TatT component family protein [Verrucomicrobiota bacterium]
MSPKKSPHHSSGLKQLLGFSCLLVICSGCSVRQFAVNQIGNALAKTGTTFTSDDDPELVAQALPFGLKLMESVLAETPEHEDLLLATSKGYTQYSYAFVYLDAVKLREDDYYKARKMELRSKKLFLRAREYGLRGLEAKSPGFRAALNSNPKEAVQRVDENSMGMMYWTAASWAGAINADKTDAYLMADLPKIDALLDRMIELDEAYENGAIHSLLISLEMVRLAREGNPEDRAYKHFQDAVELSGGQDAGPYVSYATAVCVPTERRDEFIQYLNTALSIDPYEKPELTLTNFLMQEYAQWLLDHEDNFFLPPLELIN